MALELNEARLAKLAAEEEDSKKALQTFLEGTRIGEMLPERKIVTVGKDVTVEETLKIMAQNQLIAVPVQDKTTKKFVGMFDVLDLVALSLSLLHKKEDPLAEYHKMPVGKVINFSSCDVFSPMSREMSLWHLVETMTRGIHRIPVTEKEGGEVVNVVSQSNVIAYLASRTERLGRPATKTATDLGLGKRAVISIDFHARAIDGYKLINEHKMEAVAVVRDGKLCGSLSASELRGISGNLVESLARAVGEFIQGQKKPETCRHNINLKSVIEQLSKSGQHRIWIIDNEERPIGVISQSDVMKALLLSLNVTPRRKKTRSVDFTKLRLSGSLPMSSSSSGPAAAATSSSMSRNSSLGNSP